MPSHIPSYVSRLCFPPMHPAHVILHNTLRRRTRKPVLMPPWVLGRGWILNLGMGPVKEDPGYGRTRTEGGEDLSDVSQRNSLHPDGNTKHKHEAQTRNTTTNQNTAQAHIRTPARGIRFRCVVLCLHINPRHRLSITSRHVTSGCTAWLGLRVLTPVCCRILARCCGR
ncbi:hypothetical protein K439DRAFT_306947 [Ramaria rubella]|nr:hypothetical protein K439DRAFT_306947 [Ramaria rubella]